jgi:hypothetical protein
MLVYQRVSDQGSEMHLVVQVRKCESLAIADEEKGVSSPFLRVSGSTMKKILAVSSVALDENDLLAPKKNGINHL